MKFSRAMEGFELAILGNGYSQGTVQLYHWILRELVKLLGDPEVEEISPQDLNSFMFHMRENYRSKKGTKLSGSSIDNSWKALRSFFRWASEEFSIARPDMRLSKPKYTVDPVKPFTQEEVKKLLAVCDKTKAYEVFGHEDFKRRRKTGARDTALIKFLLDTGVRISEALRLTISDLNLETGEVRIAPCGSGQKTKARTVYIGKNTRAGVWRYLSTRPRPRPDEPLFITAMYKPMTQEQVNHLLHRLAAIAGVEDAHAHRFRHTFAVEFLRGGGDVFTLQRILGHSTLTMVMRYIHLANSDDAEAHRKASPADRWHL